MDRRPASEGNRGPGCVVVGIFAQLRSFVPGGHLAEAGKYLTAK